MTITSKKPFNPDLYNIKEGAHNGRRVIWLRFEYDRVKIDSIKATTQAKWLRSESTMLSFG